MRLPGRRTRRALVALLAVAASVTVAVSVRQLLDLEDRKEVADAATLDARRDEASLEAQAADLEAEIDQLQLVRRDHLASAEALDVAVADIAHLRAKVDALTVDLRTARADRDARQGPIDLLLGCRDTLSAAIAQLAGGDVPPEGATGVLGQGASQCQRALAVAQGDTGAVHPYDFADPSILLVGDTYYAYATEGPGGAIQVLSSKGVGSWSVRSRALANRPPWAKPGPIWAPSVHAIGGRFVLYYATRSKVSGQQCISTGVADDPAGPFHDFSAVPLICQDHLGGSIDPDVYLDELGFAHLTWKSEDETVGGVAHLWTQPLGKDGLSVNGLPKELLRAERPWEAKTIENPSMAKVDGTWILLFSGNRWNTDGYAIGYAVCDSATGPCHEPAGSRVRTSGRTFEGPGGADAFVTRGGRIGVAFAAWDRGKVGNPNGRRLHIATISYRDDALVWKDL
jgi:hypothetical protein